MTKGSCSKEPDECESLMSGSEVAAEEGIPLPTITYRDARIELAQEDVRLPEY